MSKSRNNSSGASCPGPSDFEPTGRRDFMRLGLAGFASLSLPGIMRLQAASAATENAGGKHEKTAVIMVWKPGGCSHIDTYDPKPQAGSEYRGPFSTIPTKVPGLHFTELLPRQAQIADKFTVLRSMHQNAGGHPAGSMQLLSGDPDTRDKPAPRLPDWMSVANYLRSQEGPRTNPLPVYVGVNPPTSYTGAAYLSTPTRRSPSAATPTRRTSSCPILGSPIGTRSIGWGDVRRCGRSSIRLNAPSISKTNSAPSINSRHKR